VRPSGEFPRMIMPRGAPGLPVNGTDLWASYSPIALPDTMRDSRTAGMVRRAGRCRTGQTPNRSIAWCQSGKANCFCPRRADLKCIDGFQICKQRLMFQQSMLGRMIFSCLVDADFLEGELSNTSAVLLCCSYSLGS
jgi:hypothetical protein